MKIKNVSSLTMLIALVCCQQCVGAGVPASSAKPQETITPRITATATLRFDAFLSRLANCRTRLGKWHGVVKPALKELGYQSSEIDQVWNALRADKVTPEHSTLFCARWQVVHAETLNPVTLLALLTGKLPKTSASEINIVSAQ